jgi:hypothetical protein
MAFYAFVKLEKSTFMKFLIALKLSSQTRAIYSKARVVDTK